MGAYPRRHKVCLIQHKTCVIYIAELCVALALPFKLDSQVVSSLCDKSRTSRTYEHKLQEAPLFDFSQLLEKELRQPKISKINMFPFWQCFFFFLLLCKCQDTDRCAHFRLPFIAANCHGRPKPAPRLKQSAQNGRTATLSVRVCVGADTLQALIAQLENRHRPFFYGVPCGFPVLRIDPLARRLNHSSKFAWTKVSNTNWTV